MPNLANVQSIIVRQVPYSRTFVLLFSFGPTDSAREFLRKCLVRVPNAADPVTAIAQPLQLALTWTGLARLVAPELDPNEGAARLEPFFVERTPDHPAVAADMGFLEDSAPEHWWQGGFTNAQIDLAVHACFADEDDAEAGIASLRAGAVAAGLRELTLPAFPGGALNGRRPAGGILHFGYRDGITKLDIDWADNGGGTVDCREILLGYPNPNYPVSPVQPGPWQDLVRDGSFACLAWIHQDVAAFNRLLEEVAPTLPLPAETDAREWLAARMMGRWRDGSPVTRWRMAPPAAVDLDDQFDFTDDLAGEKCPLTAHIRVVHPRKDKLTSANQSRFPKGPPRFVRRGFTYGPPLAGTVDDGQERGIVGMFFCSRINEQFYTVLRWIQATTFAEGFGKTPHSKRMQDALLGLSNQPGADPRLLLGPDAAGAEMAVRDLITFRGVTCLLMPGMATLRRLSGI